MESSVCAECAEGRVPSYDGSAALAYYAGAMRNAIHLLKYEERVALAEPLGRLLTELVQSSPAFKGIAFDAVVPVPLHSSRLRYRGFNQSERLGRVIAKGTGLALEDKELLRLRATRSQASLSGEKRRTNLKDAFGTRNENTFKGKTLLLVDDVLTTSTTVSECARVLKGAGAKRVYVLALSRGG